MNFDSPEIVFCLKNGKKGEKISGTDLNPSLWIQSQTLYHCTNLTSLIRKVKYDSFILPFLLQFILAKISFIVAQKRLSSNTHWRNLKQFFNLESVLGMKMGEKRKINLTGTWTPVSGSQVRCCTTVPSWPTCQSTSN